MLGTVRIQGGDASKNNTNATGTVWVPSVQVTTAPSYLTKLVVFVPSIEATNHFIWLFDTAAGDDTTVDPVTVLAVPSGYTTTLDFGDYGKIFAKGIYISVTANEPVSPADVQVPTGANECRFSVDYKVK